MLLLGKIFLALLFVLSTGVVASDQFRRNRVVVAITAIIAIASTLVFLRGILPARELPWMGIRAQNSSELRQPADENNSSETSSVATPKKSASAPNSSVVTQTAQLPTEEPPASAAIRTSTGQTPSSGLLTSSLAFEQISWPEATSASFPLAYLKDSLDRRLASYPYSAGPVRVGATFVEPRPLRAEAEHGAIIGYLMLSLPQLGGCTRQFGGVGVFEFGTPELGIRKAIDRQTESIAAWLEQAAGGGRLQCPEQST